MLVLDNGCLVDLPDLVKHPVGQNKLSVPYLKATVGILTHIHALAGCPSSEHLAQLAA
jgi:hypothetical protein